MPSFNIGFPLAGDPWEFVLVQMLRRREEPHHVQRWFRGDPRRYGVNIRETGALKAWTAAYWGGALVDDGAERLEFIRVSGKQHETPPRWEGTSDAAACVLALASGRTADNPPHTPTVLVSCDCSFGPDPSIPRAAGYAVGFRWARLRPVSAPDRSKASRDALEQKWNAARRGASVGVPVMALVLHHDDAAFLGPAIGCQPTPLAGYVFRKLPEHPTEWPALISVEDAQLPLLARVLGMDPNKFKSNIPIDGPEVHLVGFFLNLFAKNGMKLSVDEWEQALPEMISELNERLALRLLPGLSHEESAELAGLVDGIDDAHATPEQQRQAVEFWARVGAAHTEEVETVVKEFGEVVKEAFATYAGKTPATR